MWRSRARWRLTWRGEEPIDKPILRQTGRSVCRTDRPAVGPGTATITVTTPNNKTAKLTIRVKGDTAVSKGMEIEPALEIITEDTPEEEESDETTAPDEEPEAGETTLDLESITE